MKKTILLAGICLVTNGAVNAATINFNNFAGNATTSGIFAVSSAIDGNDVVYTFTGTGDIDGLGGSNDTFTFDLRHEAFTGSSLSGSDVILGTSFDLAGSTEQHFGPANDLDNNQSFQLSIENINFVQGEGLGYVASFDGFTDFDKFINEAEDVYFGTTNAIVVNAADVPIPGGSQEVLTVSIIGGDAGNRFRNLDFGFTVDAIPEPSSTALFGLGCLAMTLRRQRK